jgi:hypothetical protein
VPNTPGGDGIIHDNESFEVQWAAQNIGTAASPAFTDLLVISSVPEGCPGDDKKNHAVVYNSERDAENPQDFLEGALNPGQTGSLMQPSVGPFPAGSYRLTVTLAKNISNTTLLTCIDIIEAS